ncbi:MAG: hypothetical protein ACI33K_10310 [Clostridiaceae bacterium]
MKYIGPFLRMNSLKPSSLENQLFFFARESLKHLVLKSRCGITMHPKVVKKNIPNIDINIIKDFSPLLCIYRKANPKIIKEKDYAYWDSNTFKKEIVPSSCAYMTLSMLELCDYYEKFKDIDNSLYTLSTLYKGMARQQLDFYSAYLRNEQGVFIIKKNISDDTSEKLSLEAKESKFKFSEQAVMMAAFYRYYLVDPKEGEAYKRFSEDIFNALCRFRESLYEQSFEELNKIAFSLNLYNSYCRNLSVEYLLLDIIELMNSMLAEKPKLLEKINHCSLFLINLTLSHESCSIDSLRERRDILMKDLLSLYDDSRKILIKNQDKKDLKYSSEDIIYYIISLINAGLIDDEADLIATEIYKNQLLYSRLITSWPEPPSLESPERYYGFKISSENLIEEQEFKFSSPIAFENEYAPIFLKAVEYNKKKDIFTPGKVSFDSTKNLPLIFMILYFLKGNYYKKMNIE